MLRTIEYMISPSGITPFSPQFAGVQGEDGATTLSFHFDPKFCAGVEGLAGQYDYLYCRMDCTDGAGRYITGEAAPFHSGGMTFSLKKEYTLTGGRLFGSLIVSGFNNGDMPEPTVLYTLPFTLYFRDFPVGNTEGTSRELNGIVLQVKALRDETYNIAATARETKEQIEGLEGEIDATAASAILQINAARDTAVAAGAAAATNADRAEIAKTAAEAAKNAASQYVETCGQYAGQARLQADRAEEKADELFAVVGNINAVLATVVAVP